MRLAVVGVGQAGGKILDRLLEYDRRWGGGFITSAIAINTARTDLAGLERVPPEHRVLIGTTRTRGHGVGADNELGTAIASEDRGEIMGALDTISLAETEAFLVVAGLGGGTGSGAGPVITRQLKATYDEPVYSLAVLPAKEEGGIYTLNAARSLKTYVQETDNVLLFDNDAWRSPGASIADNYARMNEEIAKRFGVLFSVGEITADGIGESVVDASEIHNTLQGGGLSTVGYAADDVRDSRRGLLDRFRENGSREPTVDPADRIASLVRSAGRGRLTVPAGIDSTERALLVVSGPPDQLSQRGLEAGRRWLEEETGTLEIRAGDQPATGQTRVAVTLLLAGVTDVPRVNELQAGAVETKHDVADRERRRGEELDHLMRDESDSIEPLL
jgi:cell division GTPase FtsZ